MNQKTSLEILKLIVELRKDFKKLELKKKTVYYLTERRNN